MKYPERLENGWFRVAAAVPTVTIANPDKNIDSIISLAEKAERMQVNLCVFPELCVTGYTCGDLFNQKLLLNATERAVESLCEWSMVKDVALVIGVPLRINQTLYNCAMVICGGKIFGAVPKTYIPDYNEFYEKRWFKSGAELNVEKFVYVGQKFPVSPNLLFNIEGIDVGIEICEDLWVPIPPSCRQAVNGALITANLSATDETTGKHNYLRSLIRQQSARCRSGYVYASAGFGESSTDLVFSGNAIIAEDGAILKEGERFSLEPQLVVGDIDVEKLLLDRTKFNSFHDNIATPSDSAFKRIDVELGGAGTFVYNDDKESNRILRKVIPYPFIPSDKAHLEENCREITNIQTWGLIQRLNATGCKNVVIGISGGLDSTLALLVAVKAFDRLGIDRKGVHAITMPGFGTTGRTRGNAWKLMEELGVDMREISINDAVSLHFKDIDHNSKVHDATYENSQARERTQILMDLANKYGGMVVGTGDLSESALGWATYNGDHISMYGVNAGVPKTLVRHLVEFHASEAEPATAETLRDIIDTPISPELIPANADGTIAQKTEDLVGPYELHDFFLFHTLRNGFTPTKIFFMAMEAFKEQHSADTIKKWLITFYRRFFSQQFKRSCTPDAPKVGSVCLSPRGDWRMPSDASSGAWIQEAENIDCSEF